MMLTRSDKSRAPPHLAFVRHGATPPNLAGLRCGGDLDVPLANVGRQQAEAAARHIARLEPHIGVIVTSHLQRTRETAAIIALALGGVEVVVDTAFAERRLGGWNLLPVAATEPWLRNGQQPPGGEAGIDFKCRVHAAALSLLPRLHRRPLLVGSIGVARVLGELLGLPGRLEPANGEVMQFDLSPLDREPSAMCLT